MNAIAHKLVTPGWPMSSVGNDPSSCCCLANHASARSTAASTRSHSACGNTLVVGSSVARDIDLRSFVGAAGFGFCAKIALHAPIKKSTTSVLIHVLMTVSLQKTSDY